VTVFIIVHSRIVISIEIPMQTRRFTRLTQIIILRNESTGIRIIVSRPEVDKPGILIMLLAGKYLPVDAVTLLADDMPPRIEKGL
jgi:hypothetical protein